MTWKLKETDLKKYPHFDDYLSMREIESIVTNPDRVKKNAFYPFIRYIKVYQPFRSQEPRPPKKERPIRYASRRDAYIFSYYRHLISEKYEAELRRLDIHESVIAYRKIPLSKGSSSGKCNINFANDAFNTIKRLGDCSALVVDISKYFESLGSGLIV